MGINKLVLSNQLAAELYRNSLVLPLQISGKKSTLPPETTQTENDNDGLPFTSIGNNTKKILILQKAENHTHIADDQLQFLIKILAACGLGLADVAIVNQAKYPTADFKEMNAFFNAKNVLLFDIEPAGFGLPMRFPHFQVQSFDGSSFLYAPSLQELATNTTAKKACWAALKKLFNI